MFHVIEDRQDGVVIALGDGIELVVVALGAIQGEPQPDAPDRIDAINDALDAVLLDRIGLSPGLRGIAVKASGQALFVGCFGQHIARQLLDGELVEGLVAVKGPHYPVAPRPNLARLVIGKAPGVGVAG